MVPEDYSFDKEKLKEFDDILFDDEKLINRVVRYDDLRPFHGIEKSKWGADLFNRKIKRVETCVQHWEH